MKDLLLKDAKTKWKEIHRPDLAEIDILDGLHKEFIPDIKKGNILSFRYYKNNLEVERMHCSICGHSWDQKSTQKTSGSFSYKYFEKKCPKCGLEVPENQSEYFIKKVIYIREFNPDEKYLVLSKLVARGEWEYDSAEVYDELNLSNSSFTIKPSYMIDSVFSFRFGLLVNGFSCSNDISIPWDTRSRNRDRLLRSTSQEYAANVESLKSLTFIGNENSEKLKEYLGKEGMKDSEIIPYLIEESNKINSKKKSQKKKELLLDEAYSGEFSATPTPEEIIEESIRKTGHGSIFYTISDKTNYALSGTAFCTCGEKFNFSQTCKESNEKKCPKCNAIINIPTYYNPNDTAGTHETMRYKKLQLLSDKKVFCIYYIVDANYIPNENRLCASLKEYGELIDKKSIKYFQRAANGNWEKSTATDVRCELCYYGQSEKAVCLNTDKELIDIISNSVLKYCGILEAWGLVDGYKEFDKPGDVFLGSFVSNVIKLPILEKIIKVKLYCMARELMDNNTLKSKISDIKADSLMNALNVNKTIFSIIREENSSLEDIRILRKLFNADPSMDKNSWKKLQETLNLGKNMSNRPFYVNTQSAVFTAIEIAEEFGIKIKNIAEYLRSCYDNQCIVVTEAITIWRDYLRMATAMGYDLKKSSNKMPGSLKKEHDRAVFTYKVVQDEINAKAFRDRSLINKKYEYTEDKNFSVIIPMTPEEVVAEGDAQKHCVASYVNTIRDGRTVVAFIRRNDEPDTAYFTMEINNDSIVQIRGFCNCLPSESTLLKFIKKFAKAKDLEISCSIPVR